MAVTLGAKEYFWLWALQERDGQCSSQPLQFEGSLSILANLQI
jgi:hypothetical protein